MNTLIPLRSADAIRAELAEARAEQLRAEDAFRATATEASRVRRQYDVAAARLEKERDTRCEVGHAFLRTYNQRDQRDVMAANVWRDDLPKLAAHYAGLLDTHALAHRPAVTAAESARLAAFRAQRSAEERCSRLADELADARDIDAAVERVAY